MFHKLKIIIYFCIPNLIVVTKQRDGKFANDPCFERTKKKKEKEEAISRLTIKRANERDVTRPHGILANSRDTTSHEESSELSWMENLLGSRVTFRYEDLRGNAIDPCDPRILATFFKRTRDINLANGKKQGPPYLCISIHLRRARLTSISR